MNTSTALKVPADTAQLTATPGQVDAADRVTKLVTDSWRIAAPFWPLKNLIAVNPLLGLEDMPVERAMQESAAYFQLTDLPGEMHAVNRETIKWCQAFFDDGQATVPMPGRQQGFYRAWRRLAVFDERLHGNDADRKRWLAVLPDSAEAAISECLAELDIPATGQVRFLTLLLTTLPGWAAHIKYRTEWHHSEPAHAHPVSQAEYLAARLAVTCLLWPGAASLLDWHARARRMHSARGYSLDAISSAETAYREPLLQTLERQAADEPQDCSAPPAAQLVFCIDVRSEPFRRAVESTGDYDTLGFAGFFGVPVQIEDETTGKAYASCPVLLQPQHRVVESATCTATAADRNRKGFEVLALLKRLYQSVKYTFTTPFALVEALGPASGASMFARSFLPSAAARLRTAVEQRIRPPVPVAPDLEGISSTDRCAYAESALRMMGLTQGFSRLVVLCGHGSSTQNNAYATALDCGACGGRHGAGNARILAGILNDCEVRAHLATSGIDINDQTRFIAAEHDTTTDAVTFYDDGETDARNMDTLRQLKRDLAVAQEANSAWRLSRLGRGAGHGRAAANTAARSRDWAQVRPEWGLARNASFIVAPRALTRDMDLEGRAFLHSYDWERDPDGTSLTVILTAPMVVAQWINTQYLFSTLDNVAYGGGSKVTKNITGKLGIMQGNASDLMHGLPLQSVFSSDREAYHEPLRLMTVVYAPRHLIDGIVARQEVLQKLFGNGWVTLACIDPEDGHVYTLQRDLQWQAMHD